MSLILDALRKSDVERSRQQAPQVAATTSAADEPARGRRILLPVMILLACNILLLLWVLFRPSAAPETIERAAAAPVASSPERITQEAPRPVEARPSQSQPVSQRTPPKAEVQPLTEAIAPDAETVTPTETTSPAVAAPATTRAAASQPARQLTSASQLVNDGVTSADALSVQLHVFNDDPSARFAFIGGSRRVPGDTLGNGIRVDDIIREGIILEYGGEQYLLSRD